MDTTYFFIVFAITNLIIACGFAAYSGRLSYKNETLKRKVAYLEGDIRFLDKRNKELDAECKDWFAQLQTLKGVLKSYNTIHFTNRINTDELPKGLF